MNQFLCAKDVILVYRDHDNRCADTSQGLQPFPPTFYRDRYLLADIRLTSTFIRLTVLKGKHICAILTKETIY